MSTPAINQSSAGSSFFSKIKMNPAFGRIEGYDSDGKKVYSTEYTTPRPSAPTIVTSFNQSSNSTLPVLSKQYYDFSKGNAAIIFQTPINLSDTGHGSKRTDGKWNAMMSHKDIPGTAIFNNLTVNIALGITATRRSKSAQSAGCNRITDITTFLNGVQSFKEAREAAYLGKPMVGPEGTQTVIDYDDTLFTDKKDSSTGNTVISLEIAGPTETRLEQVTKTSPETSKSIKVPDITLLSIEQELLSNHPGSKIVEINSSNDLTGKTLDKNTIYVLKDRVVNALKTRTEAFTVTVNGKKQTFQNSTSKQLSQIGDRIAASYRGSGEDPVALMNKYKDQLDIWDIKADIAIISNK